MNKNNFSLPVNYRCLTHIVGELIMKWVYCYSHLLENTCNISNNSRVKKLYSYVVFNSKEKVAMFF